MRSTHLIIALLVGLIATPVSAINLKVSRQDMKLATQVLMEKDTISSPIISVTDRILDDEAGDATGAVTTVTTFDAQPDVARNLIVTPGGTAADMLTGNVVITGTDLHGVTITEHMSFQTDQLVAFTGTQAFLTVTSIAFPIESSPYGVTWDVGVGDVLGLRRCMASAGHVVFATLDGVYESTRPTVTQSTGLNGNTADINGTLDGSKDVEVFYLQNFTCLP